MSSEPPGLPDDFRRRPGASEEQLSAVQESLGAELPDDYLTLLRMTDGGEGPIGEMSYLSLWSSEALVERNRGYKFDEDYARDLTLIGTDGGNEVFAIRRSDGAYVSAP